jgi:Ni,Fe-hydrogenase III component G
MGGEIKLFHAVSLKAGVDAAVLLASRYPRIAPVMSKMTHADLLLTAVIEDDLDRRHEAVQFALSMMEEEKIRIAVAAEMPLIAEVARRELGA